VINKTFSEQVINQSTWPWAKTFYNKGHFVKNLFA